MIKDNQYSFYSLAFDGEVFKINKGYTFSISPDNIARRLMISAYLLDDADPISSFVSFTKIEIDISGN